MLDHQRAVMCEAASRTPRPPPSPRKKRRGGKIQEHRLPCKVGPSKIQERRLPCKIEPSTVHEHRLPYKAEPSTKQERKAGPKLPSLPLKSVRRDVRKHKHHHHTTRGAPRQHALGQTRFLNHLRPPSRTPATTRTHSPPRQRSPPQNDPPPHYRSSEAQKIWMNMNLYSTSGMWAKRVVQPCAAPRPAICCTLQHQRQRNLYIEPLLPKLPRALESLSFGATKLLFDNNPGPYPAPAVEYCHDRFSFGSSKGIPEPPQVRSTRVARRRSVRVEKAGALQRRGSQIPPVWDQEAQGAKDSPSDTAVQGCRRLRPPESVAFAVFSALAGEMEGPPPVEITANQLSSASAVFGVVKLATSTCAEALGGISRKKGFFSREVIKTGPVPQCTSISFPVFKAWWEVVAKNEEKGRVAEDKQLHLIKRATMGVDTDGDGIVDLIVSGVDLDEDGVPDVLQLVGAVGVTGCMAVLEALHVEAVLPDGMTNRAKCHRSCCIQLQCNVARENEPPEDPRGLHPRVVVRTTLPPDERPHRVDRCMVCVDDGRSMITLPQCMLQRCEAGVSGATSSKWLPDTKLALEASDGIPTPDDSFWQLLDSVVPTEFFNPEHAAQKISVKVVLSGPKKLMDQGAPAAYLVLGFCVDKFWWATAKDEQPDLQNFFISLKLDLKQPIIGYLNDPSIFCPLDGGCELVNSVLLGFCVDAKTHLIAVNHVSFASGMIDLL